MSEFIREPCLCCECEYWTTYTIDQTELGLNSYNWGECLKGKPAFPEMKKCKDFIIKEFNV